MNELPNTFKANGTKYYVLPFEKVSLSRANEFEKRAADYLFFKTKEDILKEVYNVRETLAKGMSFGSIAAAIQSIDNILSNPSELRGETQTQIAMMLCCTFIIKEGENKAVFNPELDEGKTNDWFNCDLPAEFFKKKADSLTPQTEISRAFSQIIKAVVKQEIAANTGLK